MRRGKGVKRKGKRDRAGMEDLRAACGGGEEGLEHGKVGKVELGEDHGWLVDACCRERRAHGGAGEDVVHLFALVG